MCPVIASIFSGVIVFSEQAIASDTTYGCTITFDNNGPKTGKKSPREGCCGPNVRVYTGLASETNSPTQELINMNAHLEPDANCLAPNY